MINAVGRQTATGRMLMVATTHLDSEETELCNLTAIAEEGGPAAHALFRKVLVASASVPGIFHPVMFHVQERTKVYDENGCGWRCDDAIVCRAADHSCPRQPGSELQGSNVYVIVNGRLATEPQTTPINTLKVLENSFSAQVTYKTRDALGPVQDTARKNQIQFRLTGISLEYSSGNFLDFSRAHLHQLFMYGER